MMSKRTLSARILELFKADPRTEYNATTIDRILHPQTHYKKKERKKELSKIRMELHRMAKKGLIEHDHRGFYSLRLTSRTLAQFDHPPLLCHRIHMTTTMLKSGTQQKTMVGDDFEWKNFDEKAVIRYLVNAHYQKTTNDRYYKQIYVDGRRVTVTAHPKSKNRTLEVSINCTNNPMQYPDFIGVINSVKGYIMDICEFRLVYLDLIECNVDFPMLRMEGVSCLTLKTFVNGWLRVYNKPEIDVMRMEAGWTGKIPISDALNALLVASASVMKKHEANGVVKEGDGGMYQ